jgi:formamidopyrimidine-DNA glycosylase
VPELPEVETIRRQLDASLIGRSVSSVETRWHKSFTGRRADPGAVVGRPVTRVWRRGKVLGIDTDGGISLLTHLRMTGQLLLEPVGTPRDTLSPRDTRSPRDTSATRVVFGFDDGSRLYFNDQRKFGRLVVLPTADVAADPLLARMGPEPLEPGFDAGALGAGLARHPSMSLKAALLDQGVVAGIGNIYVDEALWHAGLHPQRRCGAVRRPAAAALRDGIVTVLSEGVARGGSTLRDYVDSRGRRGGYLDIAAVYGRSGQPCRRCSTVIVKITVAGRGTHLCPSCQAAPRKRQPPRG